LRSSRTFTRVLVFWFPGFLSSSQNPDLSVSCGLIQYIFSVLFLFSISEINIMGESLKKCSANQNTTWHPFMDNKKDNWVYTHFFLEMMEIQKKNPMGNLDVSWDKFILRYTYVKSLYTAFLAAQGLNCRSAAEEAGSSCDGGCGRTTGLSSPRRSGQRKQQQIWMVVSPAFPSTKFLLCRIAVC